jgi:hypothetical protein
MANHTELGLGKRQRKALDFIRNVDGWHSYDADVLSIVRSLASRGLVEVSESTSQFRALYPVKCDQCQMASINGIACHETGCVNAKKTWDASRGDWVRYVECWHCGCEVEQGTECTCLDVDGLDVEPNSTEQENS